MSEIDYSKIMTPEFGAAMGKGFAEAMKATLPGNSTSNLIHGRGSLLGGVAVGIDPDVISAMMHWQGLADHLPRNGVRTMEVLLPFITGVEPTSSTEPNDECGDCISGETEACIHRGDIDLTLMNDQLGSDSAWHPGDSFAAMGGAQLMQIATAWALLFELPPLFMHALSPMVYAGNPANNQGDGYREFRGLDLLINTGFVDAFTNTACLALDSDVKNFAYGDVETVVTESFHQTLEMAAAYVMRKARAQRLTPVTWAVVMRPELWQIYSGLIPTQAVMAALMRQMAQLPARMTINMDGASIVAERDRLREAMTVPLNGRLYPVILDDGIAEIDDNNDADDALVPGQYASDVYLVPITYLGARPATRIDYKDFRFMNSEVRATDGLIGDFYKPSPDGRFMWTWVKDGWCFKIQAKIEPRIVLKTPQLAARIQNVMYQPQQHMASPNPDSPYFQKGGISFRTPATYYYTA
jgi:hypothetical protein